MNPPSHQYKGVVMALTAAVLWGVSGTCAQFLFQNKAINTEWLVSTRLLSGGVLLLLFTRAQKQPVWEIWKCRGDALALVCFSLLGMLAVQYSYFATVRLSNAATATILQYLGPVVIAAYLAVRQRKLPSKREIVALVFALAGTFLVVTHGRADGLRLSGATLFWGIISAFALAFYTIQPQSLLERWNASVVIGWGMAVGGLAFSFVHPPWRIGGIWDAATYGFFAVILVFGTLIPFHLFLASVRVLGPTNSSLLACAEPLSAAVLAIVWLHVPFGVWDAFGTACILLTIFLLTRKENQSEKT